MTHTLKVGRRHLPRTEMGKASKSRFKEEIRFGVGDVCSGYILDLKVEIWGKQLETKREEVGGKDIGLGVISVLKSWGLTRSRRECVWMQKRG